MEQTEDSVFSETFHSNENMYQSGIAKPTGDSAKLNSGIPAPKKGGGKKPLIKSEPKAVIMLDQDGTIILIEGAHMDEFNLDKYEQIGNSIHLANAEKPLLLRTISKALLKSEKAACFDTDKSTCQVTLMPIWKSSREISGHIVIVTDITAIDKGLKQGIYQDSHYRQLFENSKDAIAILDKYEKIIDVNEMFEKLFGYSKDEIWGKHIKELIVPKRLYEENEDIAFINEHGETAQFESFRRTKNGNEIEVSITSQKLFASNCEAGYYRIYTNISGKKKEEEQLRSSEIEKEILLKEIHHRVKYNLQMISSLLLLQSNSLKDKKASDIVLESQNRIKSIELVHEKLYNTAKLSRIDFESYLNSLIPHLTKSFKVNSDRIEIAVKAGNIFLNADSAIPCALIINELLSNSLKYAFPFERKGKIDITLSYHKNNKITLIVKDDGMGIHHGRGNTESMNISLQLVGALVKQLEGRMEAKNHYGNEYKINFPLI